MRGVPRFLAAFPACFCLFRFRATVVSLLLAWQLAGSSRKTRVATTDSVVNKRSGDASKPADEPKRRSLMTRGNRWIRRFTLASIGPLAVLLLALPSTAFAGSRDVRVHGSYCSSKQDHHRDHRRSSHDRGRDYDDRHHHRRHASDDRRRDRGHSWRWGGGHRATHHSKRTHHGAYACRPCGKRFHHRRGVQAHIRHQHHIPAWQIPFFVFHHASGWSFSADPVRFAFRGW